MKKLRLEHKLMKRSSGVLRHSIGVFSALNISRSAPTKGAELIVNQAASVYTGGGGAGIACAVPLVSAIS